MSQDPENRQLPPKHTVPGILAAEYVLSRSGDAVLWVPTVRVFPTGLTIDLELVHSHILNTQRRRLFLQNFTVHISVDCDEPVHFTLGGPPRMLDEPFPAVLWPRSSSNDGATAAAW